MHARKSAPGIDGFLAQIAKDLQMTNLIGGAPSPLIFLFVSTLHLFLVHSSDTTLENCTFLLEIHDFPQKCSKLFLKNASIFTVSLEKQLPRKTIF